tara:strand:+ start:16 stop:501 length:486 start_codon:yes stop_codon:yes gene_type:complete
MPNYNYYCSACDLNYVDLRTYETRNEPYTCPECAMGGCPLTYDMSKNAEGGSKSGVVNKTKGQVIYYDTDGSRKAQEKEFMHGAVKSTEEALKYDKGKSPYSKITMNYTKMEELGLLKRVTEEEKNLKMKGSQIIMEEAAKNMTKEELDRAGTRGDNRGTT